MCHGLARKCLAHERTKAGRAAGDACLLSNIVTTNTAPFLNALQRVLKKRQGAMGPEGPSLRPLKDGLA